MTAPPSWAAPPPNSARCCTAPGCRRTLSRTFRPISTARRRAGSLLQPVPMGGSSQPSSSSSSSFASDDPDGGDGRCSCSS